MVLIVVAAVAIAGAALMRNAPAAMRSAVPAAAMILAVVAFDAWHGFQYAAYYLIGLGPVLAGAAGASARRAVSALLVTVAIANVAVAFRMDRASPDWTTTRETRTFVTAHTRPGDRIVLGPPFVLVSASRIVGRTVSAVVPQPYFLDPFDRDGFVAGLNQCCAVYVGSEEWYTRPVWTAAPGDPVFARSDIERVEFNGQPVIIARRKD